jgi:hypothetical protein
VVFAVEVHVERGDGEGEEDALCVLYQYHVSILNSQGERHTIEKYK